MFMEQINYLAVLACGVANLLVGGIWYGALFSKAWVALVNKSEEELAKMRKDAPKTYIGSFIGALVMGFVLAYIAVGMKVTTVKGALLMGFFIWLGIVMIARLSDVLFEKRPFKLFLINTGFDLVLLLVMSIIVSLWR